MASPGYTEWQFNLFNSRTRTYIDDDTGVCNVLTENSPVEVTIYSNDRGTAASNPLTLTNGEARFFTADTVTAVDLSILTSASHAIFAESFAPSMHRIDVNPDLQVQQLIIPYLVVGASEVEVDTGFTISDTMLMKDCFIHVTTVATGATLNIGTSTAVTGFASGVAASTTGWPVTLLEEVLTSATIMGSLISVALTADYARKLHHRANATSGASIVYANTTSSSTAGNGYIYFTFYRLPA